MNTNRCSTATHTDIMAAMPFAPGDEAVVDGIAGTVLAVGVVHRDGACTPAVRFIGGRVVDGTRLLYL